MKVNAITAAVCLAAAAPLCTAATLVPATNKMAPATLGRLDALLTVCVKSDAKNRVRYEKLRSELIVFGEGTPYEMRVEGSATPAYKEAYAAVLEAADKAGPEALAAECRKVVGADAESAG